MKRMLRLSCLALLITAPAFAQKAPGGGIDWSKPVPGVDPNILRSPPARPVEDTPKPIEVYTLNEMKPCGALAAKDCIALLKEFRAKNGCDSEGKLPADKATGAIPACPAMPAAKP